MAVFDSPQVSVGAKLQEKTLTSNDTYTPDLGYNGFSEVTVNVPSPQVTELPIASVEEEGNIYQYIGATQAYITNPVVTESDLTPDNPTVTIDASKLSGLPIRDSGGLMLSIEIDEESEKYISFISDDVSPEEYTFNSEPCNTIEEAYAYFGITFSPSAPQQFAEVSYNSQTYTNGYFYKCIESSGSYSWTQADVQPSPVIPDPLPDQTGQSGKFLTTNGTDASWGTINALQNTGTSGSLTLLGQPDSRGNNIDIGTQSGIFGLGGYNPPTQSIAIGYGAKVYGRYSSIDNIALGYFATVGSSSGSSSTEYGNGNIAIGAEAVAYTTEFYSAGSIAIGKRAKTTSAHSLAIGSYATVTAIGAIQLGFSGTNDEAGTLKVRLGTTGNGTGWANYKLLDSDGTIPEVRLADTTNAAQGQVLTLDANLNAVWAAGGSGGGISDVTVNDTSVVSGGVAAITCATIDDTSTSSLTATWSANKLNTTIGDIESLINAL